jgi:hypothetical protein
MTRMAAPVAYAGLFTEPEPRFDGPWLVRETNRLTAAGWVTRWHYSHAMPGPGTRQWAVFAPDMVACVMVSLPNNEHGVARRFDLNAWRGNYEITRVVAHPSAPKNTASRAVAAILHVLRGEGVQWMYSYSDTGQGHHGGIYQALNAVYVGISAACPGYTIDGEPIHPRSVVSRFGTRAWPAVRDIARTREGRNLERVDDANAAKHTYILPCGGPAVNRAIRRALADRALPYPKRGQ